MAMAISSTADKIFSALSGVQDSRQSVATAALSGGLALMQKGSYAKAAAAFKQATALTPDYVDAWNMLASANTQLGKKKDAVEAYTISLKLNPNQDAVQVNLANIYIEDKKFTNAEKALKAALLSNPQNNTAQYTLGQVYMQTEKFPQAEAIFRKTIQLSPKDGNPYYALGQALSKQGRTSDAVPQFQKAMQLKKDFAPAMYELGAAFNTLGKTDKVQEQIDLLNKLKTSQSLGFASDLENLIRKPKILKVDLDNSSFNTKLGQVSLIALDPSFVTPGSNKEFNINFQFDSNMDPASVSNIMNWKISKASGGTSGLYDNGLYRPTDRASAPIIPSRVTYDPTKQTATVYFRIFQNDSTVFNKTGTIDTSHIVFNFQGKDVAGNAMDPTADQYDEFAGKPF